MYAPHFFLLIIRTVAKREAEGEKDAKQILTLMAVGGGFFCFGLGTSVASYLGLLDIAYYIDNKVSDYTIISSIILLGITTLMYSFYRLHRFETIHSAAADELEELK